MTAPVTVRFAPSPTGRIHIGNARTALINWLVAKKAGGRFILRFDDTDRERSTKEYATGIAADIAWLEIRPDAVYRQSDRIALYEAAVERLKAAGRLYACYETPEELDTKRRRQRTRGLPPVYDRAALDLSDEDRARLKAEGRQPHWRFLLNRRAVEWTDLVRGPQSIDTATLSDPVLVRADHSVLYTLTSVIDDIDLGITQVIRGEDHVVNTAVQIEIFEAMGAAVPVFAHHSLLVGADGEALSKRLGSLAIAGLREAGFEAMAVVSLASLIGTSEAIVPSASMAALAEHFDLSQLSRAPARFDPAELVTVNARLLHGLDYGQVADRLEAIDSRCTPELWMAVRGNLQKLADVRDWCEVVFGEVETAAAADDRAFLRRAGDDLPPAPWGSATWSEWTASLKAHSGRKGRALFMPLRLALTGREHGPELAALLPLIGRERALRRLQK